MTKQEIIEKIKLAEEISGVSKQFPELTYKVVLSLLLSADMPVVKESLHLGEKVISSKK